MENEQTLQILTEMKAGLEKRNEEIKNIGQSLTETNERLNKQQQQLDAIDRKAAQHFVPGEVSETESVGARVTGAAEFQEAKSRGFGGAGQLARIALKEGAFPNERKTNITETGLGVATSGVLLPQRIPGVFVMPQIALRIRDVMKVLPQGTGTSFDYVYQATRTNAASPQTENAAKSQSYMNWQTGSGSIRTIAHYVKVTRQALEDLPWLREQIDSELMYGLKVKEEAEILSGDGTGVHLSGIITQATAFDTTLLTASKGWQFLDILRAAKLQARLAGLATYPPSAFVLHPTDLAKIEMTKDSYGHYIVGDPKTGVQVQVVWGLPVVESDSITAGTFLVGAFANGATLVDRLQAMVDVAFQNEDDFVNNRVTVLCEERVGLAVHKPTAFITGSFTNSPA